VAANDATIHRAARRAPARIPLPQICCHGLGSPLTIVRRIREHRRMPNLSLAGEIELARAGLDSYPPFKASKWRRGVSPRSQAIIHLAHACRVDENGCWTWTQGGSRRRGYLHYGKNTLAYRVAWAIFRGDLDPALTLDHLCGNPLCCNPDHLEQVTNSENVTRALHARHGSDGIHCKNCGSTERYKNGLCAPCSRRRSLEHYHRNKGVV